MENYNHEVNDNVYDENKTFIDEAKELGSWARSTESHSDGFGTEKIAQGFITEFEEQVTKTAIALANLKVKLKKEYPNLK